MAQASIDAWLGKPEPHSLWFVEGDIFGHLDEGGGTANCISANAKMGIGIAVLFKDYFGFPGIEKVGKKYVIRSDSNSHVFSWNTESQILEQLQTVEVGSVVVQQTEKKPGLVFHLITKKMHYEKPNLADFKACMLTLAHLALQHKIKKLILPALGAGVDRLSIHFVVATILDTLLAACSVKMVIWDSRLMKVIRENYPKMCNA